MHYLAQGFKIPGSSAEVPIPSGIPSSLTGGLDTTGVSVIQLVFNSLFFVLGIITVVTIILSGIQWITSGGDPSKVAAARARLMYGVIGLVVAVLSFVIVQFVYTILTGQKTPVPGS